MKALVSGITGFAGTHLAEHLLACGDEVVGISRHGKWSGDVPAALARAVPLFRWELPQGPSPEVQQRLLDFNPAAVYHLAAVSVPAECGVERPNLAAVASNVEGTQAMLDFARRLRKPPRILLASSCYVYAPASGRPVVSETSRLGPSDAYGQTKLAAERIALAARELEVVVARAFQHTGPRQSLRMMVPDWSQQFASGTDPVRIFCLDAFLDLSDVRDVVRAYRTLMVDGESHEVYNVGSGICRRSGDIFVQLRRQARLERGVVETAPGRRQHPIADISRITRIGWRSAIPLSRTLADTLTYWKQRTERS